MWRVRVTTVAVEKLRRMMCVVHLHVTFSYINNTECGKTMLLWRIYVGGNKKTCEGLHAKCPMMHLYTRMTVWSWLSLDQTLLLADPFGFEKYPRILTSLFTKVSY
jgi:hypothetical protein